MIKFGIISLFKNISYRRLFILILITLDKVE